MEHNEDWVKVRKRNHPGTKTLQRMLWLSTIGVVPLIAISAVLGYYTFLSIQIGLFIPFLILITINRDSYLRAVRVAGAMLLIITTVFYSYTLGVETETHLFLLLTIFGLVQLFTFAKQDPWMVWLQALALISLIVILMTKETGLISPVIRPEHTVYYSSFIIAYLVLSGTFLVIMYRQSAKKYFQSAAIEVRDFIKLVNNSPNALIIIDSQTHMLMHANENFSKLFEFDTLPQHVSKLLLPSFSAYEYQVIVDTIDAVDQWIGKRVLKTQSGKNVQCKIVITRIRIDQNQCNLIRIYDISREINFKENLERTKERLELALLASQDGIWEWDIPSNKVYISPRWKEMLGYQDHEIANSYEAWQRLLIPEDSALSRTMMNDFVKQKRDNYFVTERYTHKNGHTVYVESRAVRVLDEQGRTQKVVGSHTDITSLVTAGQQLEKATTNAEKANEAKSEFLANMSHEIRTPLLSILGFTNQIKEHKLTPEVEQLVTFIQSSGKTLNQLLLDILDFERIRRGKLKLVLEQFDPKAVVKEVGNMYVRKAAMKGLDFVMELNWKDGLLIEGDEVRFRQILVNLFENALKFTEEGGIRVIMLLRANGQNSELCVCVTDSGPGIKASLQDSIFEAFTQNETSFARKYEGSGLGLGIVRQLVNLMHGEITVESPPKLPIPGTTQGSRFIFTIPVKTIQNASGGNAVTKSSTKSQLPPATVLVAEDNPLNLRLAEHTLKKFGLKILKAADGGEAIDQVKTRPEIALVLMDIRMPNVDGYEACIGIKTMRPDLIVIGLSANAYPEDITRSKEVGMDDYLSKPYSQEQLFEVLRVWLKDASTIEVSS